jgi:hypothetical protein
MNGRREVRFFRPAHCQVDASAASSLKAM